MSHVAVAPRWRRIAAWLAALAVGCLALLAPALWNGFALVFFDTGGYVGSVLEWRDDGVELSASAVTPREPGYGAQP